MADVFISYSRVDQTFVRGLHAALTARDVQAWVDWQDIPITAEWRAEIHAAIDAADSFVFVVSPDSVVSEVCREEFEYAAKQNKRIAPVICRTVPAGVMPQALSAINWLSIEPGTDFEQAVTTLTAALATDLDWVRTHTRLLVRAREWQENSRDPSFLLRGQDLQDAEQWIAGRGTKEPAPSDLHVDYLVASRRAARSRQRVLLAGVTTALVVTSSLAVIAYVQRERAEDQAEVARSRELAARATSAEGADPERGLLLAVEAVRARPTQQAVSALRGLLPASLLVARMRGHEAPIASASFSSDGRQILSGSYDGTMRLWDAMTGQEVRRLGGHTESIDAVSMSDNGRIVASASRDGTAEVWSTERDEPLGLKSTKATQWMTGVLLAPDGSTLVTVADGENIKVWNTRTGELLRSRDLSLGDRVVGHHWTAEGVLMAIASFDTAPKIHLWNAQQDRVVATLRVHRAVVNKAVFAAAGKLVLTAGDDSVAHLWDTASGQEIGRFEGHELGVRLVALSLDGRMVATNGPDFAIQLWDASSAQRLRALRGHTNTVRSVAFSPDGARIASAGEDGTARLWDSATGKLLAVYRGHGAAVTYVEFSPDGTLVLTTSNDSTIGVWRARDDTSRVLRSPDLASSRSERATRLSADGRMVAVWTADGGLRVETIGTGKVLVGLDGTEAPRTAYFSPSSTRLLTIHESSTVAVRDLASGEKLNSIGAGDVRVTAVALGEKRRTVAFAAGDASVRLRSADGSDDVAVWRGHGSMVSSVAFDPSERFLASAAWDGTVRVWDRDTARERYVLRMDQQPDGVVFSADGSHLAAWSRGNLARVWDTRSGSEVATLLGHTGPINSAAFGDQAGLLATASDDGTLRVWDVRSGRLLTTFRASLGQFTDVVLLTSRVVGSTRSGAVVEFSCAVCAPLQQLAESACQLVTRNLTWDEWQQAFETLQYRKTCAQVPVHSSVIDAVFTAARGGRLEHALDQLDAIARLDTTVAKDLDDIKQKLKVEQLFEQSARQVAAGQGKSAMLTLEEIERTYPQFRVPIEAWSNVCWAGVLRGDAAAVLSACDRAVERSKEDEAGPARGSRGVARAVLNDRDGAIEDFVAFLDWAEDEGIEESEVMLRRRWLDALRRGENPFDAKTLASLAQK